MNGVWNGSRGQSFAKGIPFAEQNPGWHHKNKLSDEELARLYAALEAP